MINAFEVDIDQATESDASSPYWLVMGGEIGAVCHCKRCGLSLKMDLPQSLDCVLKAMEVFGANHHECQEGEFVEPRPTTPEVWLSGRDTGTSSLAIYAVMTSTVSPHGRYDVPCDPQDFGRCYRLLNLFPDWKYRLGDISFRFPQWKPIIAAWPELTALYEEEMHGKVAPKLYVRLTELRMSTKLITRSLWNVSGQ